MTTKGNNSKDSKSNIKNDADEYKIEAPDGGYGWVVLMSAFFISFILDGVMYSFGIIKDKIKDDNRDIGEGTINLLPSLNTGFLFCSGPIVSGLVNQFGCRSVVMGGAIITSMMYVLTVYSPNVYYMMATYGVIGGISTGCTYIASLIIIADYFDKKRGIATGITMAGSGVGGFVFARLIGLLIESTDWKITMSICACIIFQSCVFGALLRPLNPIASIKSSSQQKIELKNISKQNESQRHQQQHHHEPKVVQTFVGSVCSLNQSERDVPFYEKNGCLRVTVGILKEMFDFKLLCQNTGFLLITLSNFFIFTGYFTPFLYIVKIAEDKTGVSNGAASMLLSTIGIVNIPFRMIFGFVADRKFISAINLNTISVLISTVPLFFIEVFIKAYWSYLIFVILFAIGMAGFNSLTTMYLCDLVGLKRFSNATGIVNLFRGLGCFLGPVLAGEMVQVFGDPVKSFYFSAICFSVGLVFSLLVSLLSVFQNKCLKRADENEAQKTNDESDLNKNLLNRA